MTLAPLVVIAAFQNPVMRWSPGNVNRTVQPLIAVVPVFATVTLAVKPPCHSSCFAYVIRHEPPADGDRDGDADAEGDRDAEADGDGDGEEPLVV